MRSGQISENGTVDKKYAKKIADCAVKLIVHLPSQKAISERLGVLPNKINVIAHGTEFSDEDPVLSRKRLGLPGKRSILLMYGF